MADHTPGPWHVCGDMIRSTVSNAAMRSVAKVYVSQMHGKPEAAANARLIAAAPDLLAACRAIEPHIASNHPVTDNEHPYLTAVRQLRAAIDRAEGKP